MGDSAISNTAPAGAFPELKFNAPEFVAEQLATQTAQGMAVLANLPDEDLRAFQQYIATSGRDAWMNVPPPVQQEASTLLTMRLSSAPGLDGSAAQPDRISVRTLAQDQAHAHAGQGLVAQTVARHLGPLVDAHDAEVTHNRAALGHALQKTEGWIDQQRASWDKSARESGWGPSRDSADLGLIEGVVLGASTFVSTTVHLMEGAAKLIDPIDAAVHPYEHAQRQKRFGELVDGLKPLTLPSEWIFHTDRTTALASAVWQGAKQGALQPYQNDLASGDRAKVVGRAAFDVGLIATGVVQGLRALRAASAVEAGVKGAAAVDSSVARPVSAIPTVPAVPRVGGNTAPTRLRAIPGGLHPRTPTAPSTNQHLRAVASAHPGDGFDGSAARVLIQPDPNARPMLRELPRPDAEEWAAKPPHEFGPTIQEIAEPSPKTGNGLKQSMKDLVGGLVKWGAPFVNWVTGTTASPSSTDTFLPYASPDTGKPSQVGQPNAERQKLGELPTYPAKPNDGDREPSAEPQKDDERKFFTPAASNSEGNGSVATGQPDKAAAKPADAAAASTAPAADGEAEGVPVDRQASPTLAAKIRGRYAEVENSGLSAKKKREQLQGMEKLVNGAEQDPSTLGISERGLLLDALRMYRKKIRDDLTSLDGHQKRIEDRNLQPGALQTRMKAIGGQRDSLSATHAALDRDIERIQAAPLPTGNSASKPRAQKPASQPSPALQPAEASPRLTQDTAAAAPLPDATPIAVDEFAAWPARNAREPDARGAEVEAATVVQSRLSVWGGGRAEEPAQADDAAASEPKSQLSEPVTAALEAAGLTPEYKEKLPQLPAPVGTLRKQLEQLKAELKPLLQDSSPAVIEQADRLTKRADRILDGIKRAFGPEPVTEQSGKSVTTFLTDAMQYLSSNAGHFAPSNRFGHTILRLERRRATPDAAPDRQEPAQVNAAVPVAEVKAEPLLASELAAVEQRLLAKFEALTSGRPREGHGLKALEAIEHELSELEGTLDPLKDSDSPEVAEAASRMFSSLWRASGHLQSLKRNWPGTSIEPELGDKLVRYAQGVLAFIRSSQPQDAHLYRVPGEKIAKANEAAFSQAKGRHVPGQVSTPDEALIALYEEIDELSGRLDGEPVAGEGFAKGLAEVRGKFARLAARLSTLPRDERGEDIQSRIDLVLKKIDAMAKGGATPMGPKLDTRLRNRLATFAMRAVDFVKATQKRELELARQGYLTLGSQIMRLADGTGLRPMTPAAKSAAPHTASTVESQLESFIDSLEESFASKTSSAEAFHELGHRLADLKKAIGKSAKNASGVDAQQAKTMQERIALVLDRMGKVVLASPMATDDKVSELVQDFIEKTLAYLKEKGNASGSPRSLVDRAGQAIVSHNQAMVKAPSQPQLARRSAAAVAKPAVSAKEKPSISLDDYLGLEIDLELALNPGSGKSFPELKKLATQKFKKLSEKNLLGGLTTLEGVKQADKALWEAGLHMKYSPESAVEQQSKKRFDVLKQSLKR